MTLASIRQLVANDAHACTFQSFGQYRTALLKAIDQASPETQSAHDQREDLPVRMLDLPVKQAAPVQVSEREFCYSIDEETFNYDCDSEALQRLDDEGELVVGATIYKGEAHCKLPSYYFDVDSMLESMGERAYDDAGEWAADFPDMTKEKKAELAALIGAWLDANVTATFYTVRNVEKVQVTAEMIADFNAPAVISETPKEQQ